MRYFSVALSGLLIACSAHAELLKFNNGKTVVGAIVSMDASEIVVKRCGRTEVYARADIAAITVESLPEDCTSPPITRGLELPSGTKIRIKLLDFIDTAREPPGQAFRATVLDPVVVEESTIIRKGAGLLLHLISIGEGNQTLDLVGVNVGGDKWANFQSLNGEAILAVPEDVPGAAKIKDPKVQSIMIRGPLLYVPSLTALTFALKTPVRLVVPVQTMNH